MKVSNFNSFQSMRPANNVGVVKDTPEFRQREIGERGNKAQNAQEDHPPLDGMRRTLRNLTGRAEGPVRSMAADFQNQLLASGLLSHSAFVFQGATRVNWPLEKIHVTQNNNGALEFSRNGEHLFSINNGSVQEGHLRVADPAIKQLLVSALGELSSTQRLSGPTPAIHAGILSGPVGPAVAGASASGNQPGPFSVPVPSASGQPASVLPQPSSSTIAPQSDPMSAYWASGDPGSVPISAWNEYLTAAMAAQAAQKAQAVPQLESPNLVGNMLSPSTPSAGNLNSEAPPAEIPSANAGMNPLSPQYSLAPTGEIRSFML